MINVIFFALLTCLAITDEYIPEKEVPSTSFSDTTIVSYTEKDYIKLSAEAINLNGDIYFRNPSTLIVIDSLLIVNDNSDYDIFSFINLTTKERIATFGNVGEGPDEIRSFAFTVDTDNHHRPYLDYLDWGARALNRIHLNRAIHNKGSISERILTLTSDFMMVQRVVQLNDSLFAGGFGIRDGMLFFKETNSGTISFTPFIPETEQTYNYHNIGMVYRGHMAVSFAKERIAVALENFNQVQIYDFNGKLLSVSQPKLYTPEFLVNENSGSNYYYYNGISVTKDRIIAGYYGVHRSKTRDLAMSSDGRIVDLRKGDTTGHPVSKIHIFDWDGNLLEKYILDSRLRAIAIDKTGTVLYGLDIYDDDNPIRKVRLSQ